MEILWTKHAKEKMRFYRLSEARLKRVLRNPKRKELGIAEGTIAIMQPTTSRHTSEIWLMYQLVKSKVPGLAKRSGAGKNQKPKIISAWRYPGKSPIRGPIPIPREILEELGENP